MDNKEVMLHVWLQKWINFNGDGDGGLSLSRIKRTILSSGAAGIVAIVIYRRITT